MASAGQHDRFKRQLLRQAVDENLETINGKPLGSTRRHQAQRTAQLRRILVSACGAAAATVAVAAIWVAFDNLTSAGTGPVAAASTREKALDPVPVSPSTRVRRLTERLAVRQPQPLLGDVIPLSVKRVAVDAGHGGIDGGTSLHFGILEKDLTKDIANRLKTLLEAASCEVVLTRSGDEMVSLKDRAAQANDARADLFVSIHVNWLPDRNARGVETYYVGPTDDPFLSRLAASENKDSGYSLADYRRLLEGVYADLRQDESRRLAEEVQRALCRTLREDDPEIVSRGVMTAPFVVLMATDMPAILAEVACLSNEHEARLLAIPSYRQRVAEALFGGITSYARRVGRPVAEVEKGT